MQNNINNSLVLQKYFGQKLTQVNLWTLSGAIGGRIGEYLKLWVATYYGNGLSQ